MRVESWSSLTLLNAVIGFTRADPAWPNPLGDCGWRVSVIEPEWLVDVPSTQQPGRIKPDVVFALRAGEALLLTECKVGTVQADQLRRYLCARVERIRDQSTERPVDAIQVLYVGTEPHRVSCERSLAETDVPLLNFSNDEARLVRGTLNEPCANGQLSTGVALRGRPPTQYIPLEPDSALEESIPLVLRALIGLALDDVHQFDRRSVAERIFGDMFQRLGPRHRTELERPVGGALNSLSKGDALGDVLTGGGNSWALRPDFGEKGGLQFRTAASRIADRLTSIAQQQPLDV